MEERDFFTREVCAVRIDDGVATVTVKSGTMRINIDMRVSTLIKNMAVCDEAVAKWRVRELANQPVPIAGRRRRATGAH